MWDAEVKTLVLKGDLCLNVTRMSVAQGHCRSSCVVRQRHPASSARHALVSTSSECNFLLGHRHILSFNFLLLLYKEYFCSFWLAVTIL
jgi:hypothetical protein